MPKVTSHQVKSPILFQNLTRIRPPRAPRQVPEFNLEAEMPPLSLEDNMAEELPSLFRSTTPAFAQHSTHKRQRFIPKERIASKSIFKKKNLSKKRRGKIRTFSRPLPSLAMSKSTSIDLRAKKSSTVQTIKSDKIKEKGMSILDFLNMKRR